MRFSRLLTWLDVKRVIREKTFLGRKLPHGIVRIGCYSDALEIGVKQPEHTEEASRVLKEWFGEWYQKDQSLIQLDFGDTTLPVEFISGEEKPDVDISIRPFWEDIAYIERGSEGETETDVNAQLPKPFDDDTPRVIAFYSFKGGVGRTLHLTAFLFALLERAKKLGVSTTVLVVDADLEAPGLTYWNRTEKQQPSVSFLEFLELYQYSPPDLDEMFSLFAREVKKAPKTDGRSTWYFLPACLNDMQLLDTPVLPEHLARNSNGTWECGDAIYRLGQAIGADYVLLDLRAGLSEISSPIVFDPRIQRFIVTTIAEQSVSGTSLVTDLISGLAAPEPTTADGNVSYDDPSLIISMLKPEFRKLPEFENALVRLRSAYIESADDNIYARRLQIFETDFNEELLYINDWEDARLKLLPTSIMRMAREWAKSQLRGPVTGVAARDIPGQSRQQIVEARKLRDVCRQYEFAENGQGKSMLVTDSLKNLGTTFRDDLPRVVSIGAKGAGKTFNYIRLSQFGTWEKFLSHVLKESTESQPESFIFPLLQSNGLKDEARCITQDARARVKTALKDSPHDFSLSEIKDRIRKKLCDESTTELHWSSLWIDEIARALDMTPSGEGISNKLADINNRLKSRGLKIVFLFDGLEDIFARISSEPVQQIALKALIDLPGRLSEIRQANIGLVIFVRRDFIRTYPKNPKSWIVGACPLVFRLPKWTPKYFWDRFIRHVVTQNLAQFENLYRAYDLSWDEDSFRKLVFWMCTQAEVIGAREEEIEMLSRDDLSSRLEQLWGMKLGSDNSKEAYTINWVFAALTDFKGRLQARDIVRFLFHAADFTSENHSEVMLEKWAASRILPPQAVRRALEPCSREKVKEAQEEYPEFKKWVEKITNSYKPSDRKIPFTLEQFGMDQSTVRILEDMGVIYEDRGKDDAPRFYMPEIFRAGLDFSLDKGARPRVLVLKRKALAPASL